jgi:hypothetical protein
MQGATLKAFEQILSFCKLVEALSGLIDMKPVPVVAQMRVDMHAMIVGVGGGLNSGTGHAADERRGMQEKMMRCCEMDASEDRPKGRKEWCGQAAARARGDGFNPPR